MRTSRFAVLTSMLTAGLIAGCGSSSHGSSTAQPASPAALITTKHATPGTVLAYGPKHLTAYMFASDTGPHSACTGQCATVWPPVLGRPRAGGGAVSADLGTTTRRDGRLQVTYRGHPLYGFVKDRDAEDLYGQGLTSFGAPWYVLSPSGHMIDTASAGASSTTSSSSSSSSGGTPYSSNGY